MKLKRKNRILAYTLGSVIFLLLPVFSSPDFQWDLHFFEMRPFLRSFITYLLLLVFFYAQTFIFLPKLYFGKRYVVFGLCNVVAFLVCTFAPSLLLPKGMPDHYLAPVFSHAPPVRNNRLLLSLTKHLFQFLVVGLFSYSLHINAKRKRAEQARTDAELAYLRAQINPHFLFNTLNSIYSLAIQKSEATADAVVQLSGMMRYVLTEASMDYVPLYREIDYISDYVALQQTRLSDGVVFSYEIDGVPESQEIAPMLLIPFVENAFKYGVNPDENCAIRVKLSIREDELQLFTYNKKVKLRPAYGESNNMGIENARKRLLSLYPLSHKLRIQDDIDSFTVSLLIALR